MSLASLVNVSRGTVARAIMHYDLYRSVEIQGTQAQGQSTGQAIAAMEKLGAHLDPLRYHYAWSGSSLDEIESGATTLVIFAPALIIVYLVYLVLGCTSFSIKPEPNLRV